MIKIIASDTIIDVVNKIWESKEDEILLEFPNWHSILNNYLSLKILKNKAGNKRITILTHDIVSKKIGLPLWIKYSLIKDSDFHKAKNFKQELLRHNFTFWEYFIFTIKKYFTRLVQFIGKKTWVKTLKYYNPYNTVKKSGIFILFLGLATSIGMFFFIFYFAVSKTYIDIIPDITIKTRAINISYDEQSSPESVLSNELKVPIKKVSQTVTLEYTHKTTGIDYEKTNRSSWEVLLINELREEQTFRPSTRLLSDTWLLYETQDWVRIPGAVITASGELLPGATQITVIARLYDSDGNFIGSRGNLSGEHLFTIPGLRFSQDKIYAKSTWDFSGGDDDVVYIVSEDDEKNAKKVLEDMLQKEAIDQLKKTLESENKMYGTLNEILPVNDIIEYTNLSISSNPQQIKPWEKFDTFTLNGTITLNTYSYNKLNALEVLKNVINDSLLTGTDKLIMIDENSLKMTVILNKTQNPFSIKATTEVNIWLSYDFDNNSNNYNQRLKSMIIWLDNDEAKNILLNEGRIQNVTIKNTPFFIKKISSNSDNIILKISK